MIENRVAHIFNEMRPEYDDIRDLWYSWLFVRLNDIIVHEVISKWSATHPRVLDIGCGTGLQSFLYATAGAEVLGVDIAEELIYEARLKADKITHGRPFIPFQSTISFVERYNQKLNQTLDNLGRVSYHSKPRFIVGSMTELPAPDNSFEHVNCCGSVLSFGNDIERALAEIFRVLVPEGSFILEIEGRWNFDAFWPILDWGLDKRLAYDMTWKEIAAILKPPFSKSVITEYPFGNAEDPVYMPLTLYTKRGFGRLIQNAGLTVTKWTSIHSFTNLIPSIILDEPNPSKRIENMFGVLAALEEWIPGYWPGCSIVVIGTKPK
jgi:ubiquinone/menaquinone biosynthesis C-methylase UbiE